MPPRLRIANLDDAEQVQAIYAPYCLTPISFELEPPGVEEMRQRMMKILALYPWLVCDDGGEILGYVYACPHRERPAYCWSVDTTVYIHPRRKRLGLGRNLYSALFQLLVLQGFYNAYAGVTLPNPASVGLHEALGFGRIAVYRQVGYKCGAWHDVAWFERFLQARPPEPQPPRTWREVQDSEGWTAALGTTP
jgi:phosphinothricin acetyltransferase